MHTAAMLATWGLCGFLLVYLCPGEVMVIVVVVLLVVLGALVWDGLRHGR